METPNNEYQLYMSLTHKGIKLVMQKEHRDFTSGRKIWVQVPSQTPTGWVTMGNFLYLPLSLLFFTYKLIMPQTFSSLGQIRAISVTFDLEFYFPFLIIFHYIVFPELSSRICHTLWSQAK